MLNKKIKSRKWPMHPIDFARLLAGEQLTFPFFIHDTHYTWKFFKIYEFIFVKEHRDNIPTFLECAIIKPNCSWPTNLEYKKEYLSKLKN